MPILNAIRLDSISPTGQLIQYDLKQTYTQYILTGGGGANLLAGVSVMQDPGDDVYEGLTYNIRYEADVVYSGGNTITIFGKQLTAEQARLVLDIEALYIDGAWNVEIFYVGHENTLFFEVSSGGGTDNVNYEEALNYIVTGTATLTSSYTIQPNATPSVPVTIRIAYNANLILDGNSVTVFGKALTAQQALLGNTVIWATYNTSPGASGWIVTVEESSSNGARRHDGAATTTYSGSGALSVNLNSNIDKKFQLLAGSGVTLVGNISYQGSGSPKDGDEFYVHVTGTFVPNGKTITLFGVTLTDDEAITGGITVHAYYDAAHSVWVAQKYPTYFYGYETVVVPVSFETDEQGTISVPIPYKFTAVTIDSCVSKNVGGAAGTVTIDIDGTPTVPATQTIPNNSTVGTKVSTTFVSSNTGTAGLFINLTTDTSPTSGRVVSTVTLKRRA